MPVAFVHEGRDMSGVVHGDDFVWEGCDEELDWVSGVLEKKYDLKNRGRLGFGYRDVRKIDVGKDHRVDRRGHHVERRS